jgi:hypothetical protein
MPSEIHLNFLGEPYILVSFPGNKANILINILPTYSPAKLVQNPDAKTV